MKYIRHLTGYAGAVALTIERDGQLFPGKDRDSPHTVCLRGETHTFWEESSKRRLVVEGIARDWDYPPEQATVGRIARHILKTVVGLDPKNCGTANSRFEQLANDGFHWHATKVETGFHPYLFEFDVKSAYFTSLFRGESLFYDLQHGWQHDSGALERLRVISPNLPKTVRTALLGCLAAHNMTFLKVVKDEHSLPRLTPTTFKRISWGMAFNAAHKAILGLHRLMMRLDAIGGAEVKRIHTDSFSIAPTIPPGLETAMFAELDSFGAEYALKRAGCSVLFDLNTGWIGRSMIGSARDAESQWRENRIMGERYFLRTEDYLRWRLRLKDVKPQELDFPAPANPNPERVQLVLPDLVVTSIMSDTPIRQVDTGRKKRNNA